jgi:hypothetical protein
VFDKLLPVGRQSRKVTDADRETPWCPGVDERDDPERRGALIPVRCRCRDHGHANSASNHLANGIEAGKSHAQFQATAGAGGVVFHLILEGIAGRETDVVIGKRVTKRNHPLPARHMITRRNQHKPVFGERKGLKFFGGIYLVPDDADLRNISGDSAHDVAAGALFQIDVNLGLPRQECGQSSG